jgi:CBS domain-containing protein
MIENTIALRIFDFLKNYPPFDLLLKSELLSISNKVKVLYVAAEERIFQQGQTPKTHFFVVREGAVSLSHVEGEETTLVERYEEGDIFGVRPLFSSLAYVSTAKASEETLLYSISVADFLPFLKKNERIDFFFEANFAKSVGKSLSAKSNLQRLPQVLHSHQEYSQFSELQTVMQQPKPVFCTADTTVQEAALLMTKYDTDALIIVNAEERPIGIISDSDFRTHIGTGLHPVSVAVSEIMFPRLVATAPNPTIADIQLLQIRNHIAHICITEDGTLNSKVIGILTDKDLLHAQSNQPVVLVRNISRATELPKLKQLRDKADEVIQGYLQQELPITFITNVVTEINYSLMSRIITLAIKQLEDESNLILPDIKFCWMSMGSAGRREQLLRTDQDNAIIFEDVSPETYPLIKHYFLSLAKKVNYGLDYCGFSYCSADIMAGNPQWCLSESEWKAQFSMWINNPGHHEVINASIFFDFDPVYGDTSLTEHLSEHIFEQLSGNSKDFFLHFMSKHALQNPPPLSFFRSFIVESNGEHKNEFDIKMRAMRPLIDAARILTLEAKFSKINSTFLRFEKLATIDAANNDLYQSAANAFEILLRYKAVQGLKNSNSGRFFNPADLTKLERLMLKDCFVPIKELQTVLSYRFRSF